MKLRYNNINIIPLGWIYPFPPPLPAGRPTGGTEGESAIFPSKMLSGASSQQVSFFDWDFLSFWRRFEVEIWWFFTLQITKRQFKLNIQDKISKKSKLTTISSENAIFQWKTSTENNKFSLKNVKKYVFSLIFFLPFLVPFWPRFWNFWGGKIFNFGHFSVPKPRGRNGPSFFISYMLPSAFRTPKNLPKRFPKWS